MTPVSPHRPVVAVLAVVLRDGHALLVQRANPPDAGFWGFPGGKVDAGETLLAAAERELREETGVIARADRVLTALDALDRDGTGELRHHFVLVAVLCHWQSGEPRAADDALDAAWVPLAGLACGRRLSRDVAALAGMAAGLPEAP
ncbi:NUDIX domain-containing protein [Paracoccus liaowanqingii]|uniref:NUDIX domain-containing protein n=1 Tax=Paracoccus liaowanqingii TaxID=2560053 RepID=A0A4P7HKC0_9RHOB|nr:NUDIX hydrolase [Paracoccus liaowanqingii]QBX33511.1 NUDIX domain-containing protein [Paracoccus liaowanqingii]